MAGTKKAKKAKLPKMPKEAKVAIKEMTTKEVKKELKKENKLRKMLAKELKKDKKQRDTAINRALGVVAITLCIISSVLDVITRDKDDLQNK